MQAVLALEDGVFFTGEVFGATGAGWGEVVFHTGMTGYLEVLTDPAYSGQIVVMTYPLIGNYYNIGKEDFASKKSFARGFVVREDYQPPGNWRSSETIDSFLAKENVIGLAGIDTRALTKHLRSFGVMRGVISTGSSDVQSLIEQARSCPHLTGQELVPAIATDKTYTLPGDGQHVVVLDFGAKDSIISCLQQHGCTVTVVPPHTTAGNIMTLRPAGVVLSNGPGDPMDVTYAIETVRELIGKTPVLGISLGHQVLGLALGAKTYKMKFGHRGTNHPVQDLETGRVYVSAHNHGFSIDEKSMQGLDIIVSHRNLNDGTVEGLKHKFLPVFSVQYHPEASPGPRDSEYIFKQFLAMLDKEGR